MRKPAFYKCENKGVDQLGGYRAADQRLCFRYMDTTMPVNLKFQALPSSVVVQPGLYQTHKVF